MTTPMNRSQFITALENNGISLDESRLHEVNYYWKLWCDTLKQMNKKPGVNPADFEEKVFKHFAAFITWMKKQ